MRLKNLKLKDIEECDCEYPDIKDIGILFNLNLEKKEELQMRVELDGENKVIENGK